MSLSSELVERMNSYPKYARLEPEVLTRAYETVTELVALYERSDFEKRRTLSAGLSDSAKYILAEYATDQANEGRRMRSEDLIRRGLVSVVMAGGRSDTATGGMLMAILRRSAEISGADPCSLFEYAATLATNEEAASQIRSVPNGDSSAAALRRYGMYEKRTPNGIVYEHESARYTWWDRLRGRKKVTREDTLRVMREIEALYEPRK